MTDADYNDGSDAQDGAQASSEIVLFSNRIQYTSIYVAFSIDCNFCKHVTYIKIAARNALYVNT